MFRLAQASSVDDTLASALEAVRGSVGGTEVALPPFDYELDADPAPSLFDLKPLPTPQRPRSPPPSATAHSGIEWLRASLPSDVVPPALAILQSPSSDNDIADSLLELCGFDRIELVGEAIQRRSDIISSLNKPATIAPESRAVHHHEPSLPVPAPPPQRDHLPQAQITFQTSAEVAAAKKARKALQRGLQGKGRSRAGDEGGDFDEADLSEWERIRAENLAQGPGPMISGDRQVGMRAA